MVAITGANGFFGAHLLVAFAGSNVAVRALHRSTSDLTFAHQLLQFHQVDTSLIEWQIADIQDIDSLNDAFENVKTVIHCAGLVSFSQKQYDLLLEINRDGTRNVVNACIANNIQKLIYISSIAALESKDYKLEKGGWQAFKKDNPYGFSKYLGELEIVRGSEEGLQTCIMHPGVIIGPSPTNNPLNKAWKRIRKGLTYYPAGSTGYSPALAAAKYIVDATYHSMESKTLVADNISFKQLIAEACVQFGAKPPKKKIPALYKALLKVAASLSETFQKEPLLTKMGVSSLHTLSDYKTEPSLQPYSLEQWFSEIARFEQFVQSKDTTK